MARWSSNTSDVVGKKCKWSVSLIGLGREKYKVKMKPRLRAAARPGPRGGVEAIFEWSALLLRLQTMVAGLEQMKCEAD